MTTPAGWERKALGELGRYLNGRAFKKQEWRSTGRPIIRIQNLTGSSDAFNFFEGEVDDRYVVRPGDLLVSWAATLGSYIWTGPEAVLNQHIFKVESNIDLKFHKYLLDHKLDELMRHTHGSGMVHITRGRFDAVPVDIPPNDEQRRIVDLLEDHLSRLDAADSYLDAALRRSEMLRWGSVAEAVSTAGGRQVRLGDIASVRNGIFVSRPGSEPNGVPILRIGAVRSLSLDLSDLRYSERTEEDLRESDGLAQPGDLLFTRYNGNPRFVGACAAVPEDAPVLTYPDKLIRVRVTDDAALSEFVALACSVGAARAEIQASVRTTAGQAGIAGRDLKNVTLTLPDLEAQRVAIRAASESGIAANRLSHELEIAQRRAAALRRSLLASAFSGRLIGAGSDLSSAEEMINA